MGQCSARAAQNIWEHHRPAIGSHFHALKTCIVPLRSHLALSAAPHHRQARREAPTLEASTYLVVEISFVNGINQTGHPTNQQRPCTTIQRILKELSICQSSHCPDLVRFPVLSQIKPHTPRLVVSFRQFLQVSALRMYSPLSPKTLISRFRGWYWEIQ